MLQIESDKEKVLRECTIFIPDGIRVVTRNDPGRKCLQINCRRLEMCLNHL